MLVTRIYGGLGNQMFQYAAGKSISINRSDSLMLDTTAYGLNGGVNLVDRDLDILDFNIEIVPQSTNQIIRSKHPYGLISKACTYINKRILNKYYYGWHPELYDDIHLNYLDGYFQSQNYADRIKDCINSNFKLKPYLETEISKITKIFQDNDLIAVHVRRGDYFSNPRINKWHGICNAEYYERGIQYFRKHHPKMNIILFSDDVNWCRNNIEGLKSSLSISDYAKKNGVLLRASQELFLMSQCRHFLISNSTFSWWAQYLCRNEHKEIVSPSSWNLNPKSKNINLMDPKWHKINVP